MQKTKKQLYDQIKDLQSLDEFNAEIKKRKKEYDSLFDETTIALLIVDELGRNTQNISKIADLKADADATIYGKITNIDKMRSFNRKNGSSGKVINLQITDDSGSCRLALWDKDVELVQNQEINIGSVVKIINGYVKDGFNGLEINVGKYGLLEINSEDLPEINTEKTTNSENTIKGVLVDVEPTRAFFKDSGEFGFVTKIKIQNKNEETTLSVWDDKVKEIQKFKKHDEICIENFDTRQKNGVSELHVNGKATIKKI